MQEKSKLKPTNWSVVIAFILAILLFSSIFIIIRNFVDYETKIKILAIVYIIFSLINLVIWLTQKSLISLSLLLICLIMAASYFFDYKGIFIFIPLLILWTVYGYFVYLYRKFNSSYKRLLELAAKPVNDIANGFSSRPFPAGELSFTKKELMDFTNFLKKHFIAFPYIDKNRILLLLTDQSKFWFGGPHQVKDSYVTFSFDGKVTVNIAIKEYKKYKEEYTFDKLCEALGNLFKEFFVNFQQNNTKDILKYF
jgi:hypothetical protein